MAPHILIIDIYCRLL